MTIGNETSPLPPPRTRRNTAEKVRSTEDVASTDPAMPSPSNCTLIDLRKSTLWKFICLNMFVCGIEICASAGFTYLPPMMLKAGFGEQSMTFVMGIGPFIALIAVPFLGRWSDRCRRRKPFLVGIALLMITSLILIAHGRRIGRFIADGDAHLQAVLLVLGIVLLDFGCHAGFNPCEALVADFTTNSKDNETGFTVYSTMISVGGCIGYIITAVDWSPTLTTSKRSSGVQEDQIAFSVILFLYIAAVITTITVAKELAVTSTHRADDATTRTYSLLYIESGLNDRTIVKLCSDDVGYETASNESMEECSSSSPPPSPPPSIKRIKSGASPRDSTECHGYRKALTKFASISSFAVFATFRFAVLTMRRCLHDWPTIVFMRFPRAILAHLSAFRSHLSDIPSALRRLFVADFCSWTALMCHNMFYTDYVGQAVYGGNPNAGMNDDIGGRLYDDGVRMGSWGLLLHSIASILYVNTLQNNLIRAYGLRTTYFIGLLIFTLSMTLTLMTNNLMLINLLAALSGTGFAAITTIPNMLVTAYHSDKQAMHNLHESEKDDVLESPESGLASDFSILDSAYFLSQIVLSLSVGTIVDLTRSVSSYIVISAVFGFLACYFSTRVIFPHEYIRL